MWFKNFSLHSISRNKNHDKAKLFIREKSKRNIKFHSFYGRANETMKNEVPLPIEINIPKRFFNEGSSNILHWEKCCLSMSEWRKHKKKKLKNFLNFPSITTVTQQNKICCSVDCGTFNEQQLETLYAYLNNFNDALSFPPSGQLFQLWVYYPALVEFEFIKCRRGEEMKSDLNYERLPTQTHLNIN